MKYDTTVRKCPKCKNDKAFFTFPHESDPDEICDDCKKEKKD